MERDFFFFFKRLVYSNAEQLGIFAISTYKCPNKNQIKIKDLIKIKVSLEKCYGIEFLLHKLM